MRVAWLALLVLVACASELRPLEREVSLGTPRPMPIEQVPGHGFHVAVNGAVDGTGELLAVHTRAIFLLDDENQVRGIPRESISLVWIELADGPDIRVTRAKLDRLYQYARFPQGMPPAWLAQPPSHQPRRP